MKTKRQETILKLIAENRICTQEGLQEKLKEYGFSVTQATVSRDHQKPGLNQKSCAGRNVLLCPKGAGRKSAGSEISGDFCRKPSFPSIADRISWL